MANTVKLKRGSGSDPGASDLVVGEVAIRTDEGKLFTKKDDGTVAEISGGGGISDGDKGDITVSNSGATFTIDSGVISTAKIANNGVTFAKLQDVAQNRIIGRTASGTGACQELTATSVRTLLNVEDGATADQTKSDIDALNIDAATLDGVDGANYVRTDINTTISSDLSIGGGAGGLTVNANSDIRFTDGDWTGNTTSPKINAHGNKLYIVGGSAGIVFRESASDRWFIDLSGHFIPAADSTYDIGTSDTRVSNGYFDTLYGEGSNLTGLNGSQVTSGTISAARLASTITPSTIDMEDGDKIKIGASDDLEIFHGSSSDSLYPNINVIKTVNTNFLLFEVATDSGGIIFNHRTGTGVLNFENMMTMVPNDGVNLFFNGFPKAKTVTGGFEVTGTCTATAFSGDGSSLTGVTATVANGAIYENAQTITANYTITDGKNAMSAGPISIDDGVTLTVGTGETYVVV